MKTREQRLEEALKEISEVGEGYNVADLIRLADRALEPEFEPVIGQLYMCWNNAVGDVFVSPTVYNDEVDFDHCRPLTEQEWKELGAPITKDYKDICKLSAESLEGKDYHSLTLIQRDLVDKLVENKFLSISSINGFVGSKTS